MMQWYRELAIFVAASVLLVACTVTTPKDNQESTTADAAVTDVAQKDKTEVVSDGGEPDKVTADTKEPAPEKKSEPVKEATPEPDRSNPDTTTPDTGEKKISSGACKEKSPKCTGDYICRDDVKPSTCQLRCDPDAAKSNCPGGKPCLVLQTGEAICVEGNIAQKGELCDPKNICAQGNVCVFTAGTSGKCYERCTVRDQKCPSGEYCYLLHSFNGVCLKGSAGGKKPGEACKRTDECQQGTVCFTPYQRSARCAELCDTKRPCDAGYVCADIQGGKKGSGACVK